MYSKTTFLANNFVTASVLLFNCTELFLALLFVLF